MYSVEQSKPTEYRLKRNLFGHFVLQVKEIRHHSEDLHGTGHFDEWVTERWRAATLEEAIASGMTIA